MKRQTAPMRPRFKENVAGHSLVFPTVYAVPDGFCDTFRHLRTKECVVDVHIEVERKAGMF